MSRAKFKILINTESAYKDSIPHILTTGIPCEKFDYSEVYDREDKYSDVVGFYRSTDSVISLGDEDAEILTQWVRCLGKSLVYVVEADTELAGWLFVKEEDGSVTRRVTHVVSQNDVNYDVWLKRQGRFWSPADFLLEDPFGDMLDEDPVIDDIKESLEDIYDNQHRLQLTVGMLNDAVERLVHILIADEDNG